MAKIKSTERVVEYSPEFKVRVVELTQRLAFFSLFIPGFIYVYAQKDEKAKPLMRLFYIGLLLIAVGTILAS